MFLRLCNENYSINLLESSICNYFLQWQSLKELSYCNKYCIKVKGIYMQTKKFFIEIWLCLFSFVSFTYMTWLHKHNFVEFPIQHQFYNNIRDKYLIYCTSLTFRITNSYTVNIYVNIVGLSEYSISICPYLYCTIGEMTHTMITLKERKNFIRWRWKPCNFYTRELMHNTNI